MTVFLCFLILILIKNNKLVFAGSTTGLMLWFYNVIPLLLPFMLLSKLLICRVCQKKHSPQKAILLTITSGLLCGYPIGAYSIKKCLENGLYTKRTAELLLPLCNNSSPMFIFGYIIEKSLHSTVSLPFVYTVIYIPYIIYIIFALSSDKIIGKIFKPYKPQDSGSYDIIRREPANNSGENNAATLDITELIYSIHTIGVYIIICSVAVELLLAANSKVLELGYITSNQSSFTNILLSSIEITRGAELISGFNFFTHEKITALILALTSFGGISSILQTNHAMQNSGLSIKKYIFVKLICSCASYFLSLAII